MSDIVRLSVATGHGLLARRETALLFTPKREGAAVLIEPFLRSDAPVGAMEDLLIERGSAIGGFALVDWGLGTVQVMVFGEVELTTDQASLPLLSGSASSAWLEHRLHRSITDAVIMVNTAADPDTSLELGVVPAGGFCLTWATDGVMVGKDWDDTAQPSRPDALSNVPTLPTSTELDGSDPDSGSSPSPEARSAARDAAQLSVLGAELNADRATRPNEAPLRGDPLAPDLPEQLSGEDTFAEDPDVFSLRFNDGQTVNVGQELVIGRSSDADHGPGFVALSGAKVSRRHLAVRRRGWELYLEDLGSQNGTIVVHDEQAEPVTLAASDGEVRLDPGAVVVVGMHSFVVLSTRPMPATGDQTTARTVRGESPLQPRGSVADVLDWRPDDTIEAARVRALLDADAVPAQSAPAPRSVSEATGATLFVGGRTIHIRTDLVLGSNPDVPGQALPELTERITDPSVSARHAAIRQRGGQLLLEDLGSEHGTFLERVPGQRLPVLLGAHQPLTVGDKIWLGTDVSAQLTSTGDQ